MLTGMAIPQPDSSPIAHQSTCHYSIEIDILCADHAMLKNRSRSCRSNENFEKNGEGHRGHMWEWCEMMPINTKFIKYINHNLREPCCFLAQNGLISPWATLDTIVMSYLPTWKWNKWILTFNFENHAVHWCMTGRISTMFHSPRNLVTTSPCFRVLFLLGRTVHSSTCPKALRMAIGIRDRTGFLILPTIDLRLKYMDNIDLNLHGFA